MTQWTKYTLVASGLLVLTFLSLQYFGHFRDVNPLQPLSNFPQNIGSWTGKVGRFDPQVYDVLGVDDSFLCDYRSPEGKMVGLYIGFYKSQREGDIIHSPKNCLPGSGWNITQTTLEELNLGGSNPGKSRVIKLILEKGSQKQVALYWFQSRGRIISSEYWQKIYLVWDAVFKHRTDGSFVRLMAPVTKNAADTTRDMENFAQELFPLLEQYLPGA